MPAVLLPYVLQDARKGVLFEDFPPVLQLQLKRFEYDFQRDTMVKVGTRGNLLNSRLLVNNCRSYGCTYLQSEGSLWCCCPAVMAVMAVLWCVYLSQCRWCNRESILPLMQLSRLLHDVQINDRYEFYDTLDLDRGDGKYLAPSADRTLRNEYKLHSVLVHSGGVHGGHYYAFIRPDGKNWLKFDDDRVTLEEPHRALAEQFGGEEEGVPPPPAHGFGPQMPVAPGTGFKFTKHSNAYMLVYIRTQHWDQYMCNVTKEDIAPYLRERLEVSRHVGRSLLLHGDILMLLAGVARVKTCVFFCLNCGGW